MNVEKINQQIIINLLRRNKPIEMCIHNNITFYKKLIRWDNLNKCK